MKIQYVAHKFIAFLTQITSVLDLISTSSSTTIASARNLSILADELLQFVNDGGEIVDAYGKNEEIILVLGDADCGKSSFTSYMADEMEYLYARKLKGGGGDDNNRQYFVHDSRNKMYPADGWATRKVIPRLVEDYRSKRVYVDCPAFTGPYSEVSIHFVRKVIAAAKSVKLIFLVDYERTRASSPTAPFIASVVRRAADMLRTEKLLAAVALIATKVDNEARCVHPQGDHFVRRFTNDDQIVDTEVAVFLKRVRDELSLTRDKMGVAFVDALLERNRDDGSFARIGLFRRPDRSGPLKYSKALRESKARLDATVHENVKFVRCEPNGIVLRRPDLSEAYVHELTRKAREYIRDGVRHIGDDVRKHYVWREKSADDVIALHDLFEKGVTLFADVVEAASIAAFVDSVKRIARTSNVLISSKHVMAVRRYDEFLDFLGTESAAAASNKRATRSVVARSDVNNERWNQSMVAVLEYLNNSRIWYGFLIALIERLSGYEVRRDTKIPADLTVDDLRRLYQQCLGSALPASIDNVKVDKLKLRFLKPIFNVSCYRLIVSVQADTLTVRGSFVKLSDIAKLEHFTNPKVKLIRVFAMNTVFVDAHVDLTGREITLLILAPTWRFICDPHFVLDGQAGKAHDEEHSRTAHGADGLPGKTGGPAGHFFGIGSTFISLPSVLRIKVSGGKGGPGQDGCCGQDGAHGEDCHPLQPGQWWIKGWHRKRFLRRKSKYPGYRKELQEGNSLYIHSATTNTTKYVKVLGVKMPVKRIKYEYYCMGSNGRAGGKGGDGGGGGQGGLMGSVELIDITNRIVFRCMKSADGCIGIAGSGSAGGCQGESGISYTAIFEEDRTPFALYYRRPGILNTPLLQTAAEPCRRSNGIAGGKNRKNTESPRAYVFRNPIRSVVDYKKFAREYSLYAKINPLNAPINNFVSRIEADARVNAYDHTRAFIYDLFALENQFYLLHTKTSILPCYESLARRILRYADHAGNHLSIKDKLILSHVYSAVLSKISALKRDRNFLVMDFDRYCKSVLTEIKNLNKLNHIEMINEYKIKYENLMNRKIEEARRFIDDTIIPTIDGSFKNTGETIQMLLDENAEYINDSLGKQQELKKVLRQLKASLVARRTLGVMQLGGQFLQFLGPVGSIVGPAVEGFTMIATALISPNMSKVNEMRTKNLAEIHATLRRNANWLESNCQRLRNEAAYIGREIKKTEKNESVDLRFLTKAVNEHEQKLNQLVHRQRNEVVPFWIVIRVQEEFKMRLNKLLEEKEGELLQSKHSTKVDKKSSNQMSAIQRIKRVLRISGDIIDIIAVDVSSSENGSAIDEALIENELDEVSDQLNELRKYETVILNIFAPLCDKVYTEIQTWEKQLRDKSPASLRMSQWNVQYSLKKIKTTLKQITDGYRTQNVIMEIIDQIEEGLTMLIDMYDHIQKYHERVELEAYIANVNSYRETSFLDDPEIDRLNVLMRSNVILNLFNNAMDAFKQSVFPFAHLYFDDIMVSLPDSLRIETSTDDLVREAIARINNLNEKIRQVSSQLYDLYDNAIMKDVPFTLDRSLTPPFYVWDFKANEYVVQKLLTGSTITLTSHITKTRVDDNAVKFKNLRIRLILTAHASQQAAFDKLLENYVFELTHSGEMYFRCGRRFYFVRCNSMKLTFSFKSKANGEPEMANTIYGRIKDNYYALSPYTTWNVKLVKNKYWTAGDIGGGGFGRFFNYPMKIVLEGVGEYVKRDIDHEICNANLSKYYDSIIL